MGTSGGGAVAGGAAGGGGGLSSTASVDSDADAEGANAIANTADAVVRPGSMGHPVCGIEAGLLKTTDAGAVVFDADGKILLIIGDGPTETPILKQ